MILTEIQRIFFRQIFAFFVLCACSALTLAFANESASFEKIAPEIVQPGRASSAQLELEIAAGYQEGTTWYEIGGLIQGERWSSKLCFPLDVPIVQARLGYWWYEPSGLPLWGLKAATSRNLDHPHDRMTDTDRYPGSTVIGYTESSARLDAWSLEVCGMRRLHHFTTGENGEASLFLTAGLTWEDFSYTIRGFRGFYRYPLPEEIVWLPEDENVMIYHIQCTSLYAGLMVTWRITRSCSLVGDFAAGAVRIRDTDKHLLRDKSAYGSLSGTVTRMRVAGTIEPTMWQDNRKVEWFLRAEIQSAATGASGVQEQHFLDGSEPGPVRVAEEVGIERMRIDLAIGCRF